MLLTSLVILGGHTQHNNHDEATIQTGMGILFYNSFQSLKQLQIRIFTETKSCPFSDKLHFCQQLEVKQGHIILILKMYDWFSYLPYN